MRIWRKGDAGATPCSQGMGAVDCPELGFTNTAVPAGGALSGTIQPVLQWLRTVIVRCNLFRGWQTTAAGGADPSDVACVASADGETLRWENPCRDWHGPVPPEVLRSGVEIRLNDEAGNLLVPLRNITFVIAVEPCLLL